MAEKLTESLEDYLEAIAILIEKEGHVHAKDLANHLGVTMPSVTGALKQLVKLNYIEYNAHYPVQLTNLGRTVAHEVLTRHIALKNFFSNILALSEKIASDTACHLEHVVDAATVERFILLSRSIENRSDATSLRTYLSEAISNLQNAESVNDCVISSLENGEKCVIQKFSRNLSETEYSQFAVGDELLLIGRSLDKRIYTVSVNHAMYEIGIRLAENIWVRKT